MVSLFIYIHHRAKVFPEKTNEQKNLCQILILTVHQLLEEWVMHRDVIGLHFGGGVKYAGFYELKKEEQELKVNHAIWYCKAIYVSGYFI